MNKDKVKSFITIVYILLGLTCSYLMVIMSNSIASYRFFSNDTLRISSFGYSFLGFFNNFPNQLFVFILLEAIIAIFIYVFISSFKSGVKEMTIGMQQITDAISIPISAGQGQHGSARFLRNDEIDKCFKSNVIDLNNPVINRLYREGVEEREKLKKIFEEKKQKLKERSQSITSEKKQDEQKSPTKTFSLIEDGISFDSWDAYDVATRNSAKINLIEAQDYANNVNFETMEQETEYLSRYLPEYEELVEDVDSKFDSGSDKSVLLKSQNKKVNDFVYYDPDTDENKVFKSAGLVIGVNHNDNKKQEKVYYIDSDTHALVIGATRSGKSRCQVLQSIGNIGLAGESLVVSDPKGELFEYTSEFMKKLGYEVICIDFKNPNKSSKYILLQPIIDAWNNNDIEAFENYTEELVQIMVGEQGKGETIWYNGEKSTIAGGIMSIIAENTDERYQNLANVYNFIARGNDRPSEDANCYLKEYLDRLDDASPQANSFKAIAGSPDRTLGSFIATALTRLRLFSQNSIWQITHRTDCNIFNLGEKKTALYIILPDENTMYYSIASIIVCQIYNTLVKIADNKYGGRLPVRVNFVLDEFGNFVKIPDFIAKLTVGGGRGLRFMIFLQSLTQLDSKYSKEDEKTIVSNCETWCYLQADEPDTLKTISDKLGTYTTYGINYSESGKANNENTSSSRSLMSRNLLKPDELKLIKRPYILVTSRERPAMMVCPDISKLYFNDFYSLGDQDHNNLLRQYREDTRPDNIDDISDKVFCDLYKLKTQQNVYRDGNKVFYKKI